MTPPSQHLVLLGPQRIETTVGQVIRSLGVRGRVAAVTAGWQERESEDDELAAQVGGRSVNLELHARAEALFAADPELLGAYRQRQDRIKRLQQLYRRRLDHGLAAVRDLQRESNGRDDELLGEQIDEAIDAVRALDESHHRRLAACHAEFEAQVDLAEHQALARQRQEIAELLSDCEALAIAGGHVVILQNRLRLFGVLDLLEAERPIIAWSAGAMVLAERIVSFHDSPPQGAGNAEILETGLGRFSGVVPLPHARRRLRLEDRDRVALLSRRIRPSRPVTLDAGGRLDWRDGAWRSQSGTFTLEPDGSLVETDVVALGTTR